MPHKGSFPLQVWNGVFFACFNDFLLRLDFKREKMIKRNKECSILRW